MWEHGQWFRFRGDAEQKQEGAEMGVDEATDDD
jgi:hypothetical protein